LFLHLGSHAKVVENHLEEMNIWRVTFSAFIFRSQASNASNVLKSLLGSMSWKDIWKCFTKKSQSEEKMLKQTPISSPVLIAQGEIFVTVHFTYSFLIEDTLTHHQSRPGVARLFCSRAIFEKYFWILASFFKKVLLNIKLLRSRKMFSPYFHCLVISDLKCVQILKI